MFRPLSLFNRSNQLPAEAAPTTTDPFFRLQHEMNRLFDEAFAGFGAIGSPRALDEYRAPRLDIRETADALEIEADLPGVDEKDLDVQLTDNILTIRGEKKFERKDEKEGQYRIMERSYGSFARSVPLSYAVDPDAVEATFKNGVLKLTLPKPPEALEKARKIEVKRA
jgi:HSP20 family protein